MDRDRPRLSTSGDNANNSDDRDRQQLADDDDPNGPAFTNGDITRYRALVARISYLSQDRPDLKFASVQVCCAQWPSQRCATWNVLRGSGHTSLGSRGQSAGSAGSRVVNWRHSQMLSGAATRPLEDPCRLGSSREADTASRYGPRNEQVVALSSAGSELYAVVKTASEGLGIQSVAKDLGISCGLNVHLDASATIVLGQPQGSGQSKATSTCRICGYRRLPNRAGSPRGKLARTCIPPT